MRLDAFTVSISLALAAASGCIKGKGTAGKDAGNEAGNAVVLGSTDAGPALADAPDAALDPAALVERGHKLYGLYCDFCHGDHGQGYAADEATALANEEFQTIASDDFLRRTISKGRPGSTMSAWSTARGGPLTDPDVTAVIAYIRSWQKKPTALVDDRVVPAGNHEKGAKLYKAKCESCHGVEGHKAKYVALGGFEFLNTVSDGYLATSIEKGRPGTPMLPFAGKLSATDISDLVALLKNWKKPVEDEPELPPEAGKLQSVVINPNGPQPKFDEKADFIPIEVIRIELEKKASMIIADARPPSDYARSHIVGAIDVPFYKVEAFSPQIPKDKWILTYCACPHAASVKARDAFRKLGYKKVAVIDEGILQWRDRGYPTHAGAKP